MHARLAGHRMVALRTLAFDVEPAEPLAFKAGQTCDVVIPHPAYTDELGNTRTFSIASPPGKTPLTFATRLTDSAFKRSMSEAKAGMDVELDGPYGSFTLHHNAARPAVLLAGGIGITPFRSIVADATLGKLPHRITLFYSNTNASSAAFLDDLQAWARENPNFTLVPTITAPVAGEPWTFETGRIGANLLRTHVADPGAAVFYIAGPAGFVATMANLVIEIGADPDSVKSEEFPGY